MHHYKTLEVDFNTRNVISVAVWIHPGPGSDPPPFAMVLPWYISYPVMVSNNEFGCKLNSFCNCIFLPKGGGTQATFMVILIEF